MAWNRVAAILLTAVMLGTFAGCGPTPTPTPTLPPAPTSTSTALPTPTLKPGSTSTSAPTPTSSVSYSVYALKYRLIASFGQVFYCDPDFYPIGRPGEEEKNAAEQFPVIQANQPEFAAILRQLGLPNKSSYSDQEKLLIYREHKRLDRAVQMATSGNDFSFTLRVGEGQGERIDGTITPSGAITVIQRQPSINTCPICLTKGTLIDTPVGRVPVEDIRAGTEVWTQDVNGGRSATAVRRVSKTPAPASFTVVTVILSDGRRISASPGHPTSNARALAEFRAGDTLDGTTVASVERRPYDGGFTYDLLPSGGTGTYWAGGILLKSTLAVP